MGSTDTGIDEDIERLFSYSQKEACRRALAWRGHPGSEAPGGRSSCGICGRFPESGVFVHIPTGLQSISSPPAPQAPAPQPPAPRAPAPQPPAPQPPAPQPPAPRPPAPLTRPRFEVFLHGDQRRAPSICIDCLYESWPALDRHLQSACIYLWQLERLPCAENILHRYDESRPRWDAALPCPLCASSGPGLKGRHFNACEACLDAMLEQLDELERLRTRQRSSTARRIDEGARFRVDQVANRLELIELPHGDQARAHAASLMTMLRTLPGAPTSSSIDPFPQHPVDWDTFVRELDDTACPYPILARWRAGLTHRAPPREAVSAVARCFTRIFHEVLLREHHFVGRLSILPGTVVPPWAPAFVLELLEQHRPLQPALEPMLEALSLVVQALGRGMKCTCHDLDYPSSHDITADYALLAGLFRTGGLTGLERTRMRASLEQWGLADLPPELRRQARADAVRAARRFVAPASDGSSLPPPFGLERLRLNQRVNELILMPDPWEAMDQWWEEVDRVRMPASYVDRVVDLIAGMLETFALQGWRSLGDPAGFLLVSRWPLAGAMAVVRHPEAPMRLERRTRLYESVALLQAVIAQGAGFRIVRYHEEEGRYLADITGSLRELGVLLHGVD